MVPVQNFQSIDMENVIQKTTISLIQTFRDRLDDEWLDEYLSAAEHGEWGLAFENQCDL